MEQPPASKLSVLRTQLLAALGMLLFLGGNVVALDVVAHSQKLMQRLMRQDERVERKDGQFYDYHHHFADFEDRLINEELPAADYSKGGVYLIGTSNTKWATRLWELPEAEQELIHNYGMGSCSHGFQFQFVRYLAEHAHWLEAGGAKTMVILGASYHCVGSAWDTNGYFPSLWSRHGLFQYSLEDGITPLPSNPMWRYVHFERERMYGALRETAFTMAHDLGWHTAVRKHDPVQYNIDRTDWMGPDWRDKMKFQVGKLGEMIDYLQARQVHVILVFLPQGTWEDQVPFEKAYMEMVSDLCRKKGVKTQDWSKKLTDDEFADSNHPNLYGEDKLQPSFLDIALPFLRSTGALPLSAR